MFQPIHQQLHTGSVSASAAGLESALLPRSKPKGKFITSSVSSLATASALRCSTGQRCGTGGRMSSLTAQSPPNFRYFQTFSVSWQFFFCCFFFLDVCPQRAARGSLCLFSNESQCKSASTRPCMCIVRPVHGHGA